MSKKMGFQFLVEVVDELTGEVISSEIADNITPTEGENHILNVIFKAATQITSWFVGIYEGNYTPLATDTAAVFPANATETTTYAEATRQAFTPGAVAAGAVDNTAALATFTSNSAKTIYGMFISSASAKGATTGVLISAVKFGSAQTFGSGTLLRVTASVTLS